MRQEALAVLKEAYRHSTTFRPGPSDAIAALFERWQRVLVVQRTGWGKNVVYFVAARLVRSQSPGPTIIVSPLLAHMGNH